MSAAYRALREIDRTRVMGVVNVTADSFSDGGLYLDHDAAVAHAVELHRHGADLIDIGGESTRPGATRVDPAVEAERVVPVIARLVDLGIPTSVDTMRADVAAAALAVGVDVVNDVSGGAADPEMFATVAASDADYVLMHWRTTAFGDASGTHHGEAVLTDVVAQLHERLTAAVAAGLDPQRIILDPGLGFAKNAAHNWQLLQGMEQLHALGRPVLIGASRKRFLTGLTLTGREDVCLDRDNTTAALSMYAALNGAWGVRVHEVATAAAAVEVAHQLQKVSG